MVVTLESPGQDAIVGEWRLSSTRQYRDRFATGFPSSIEVPAVGAEQTNIGKLIAASSAASNSNNAASTRHSCPVQPCARLLHPHVAGRHVGAAADADVPALALDDDRVVPGAGSHLDHARPGRWCQTDSRQTRAAVVEDADDRAVLDAARGGVGRIEPHDLTTVDLGD